MSPQPVAPVVLVRLVAIAVRRAIAAVLTACAAPAGAAPVLAAKQVGAVAIAASALAAVRVETAVKAATAVTQRDSTRRVERLRAATAAPLVPAVRALNR